MNPKTTHWTTGRPRWVRRLYIGWRLHLWPWNVPSGAVMVLSFDRPTEADIEWLRSVDAQKGDQ